MSLQRTAPTSGPVSGPTTSSITTGGTAQVVFTAFSRSFLLLQNTSNQDLWFGFGNTPVIGQGGFLKLSANSIYEFQGGYVPNSQISVIGATTGQNFLALQG